VVPGSPVTSSRLCRRLTQLGADVIASPVIRIADPPDWARVDRAIAGLDEYDWIVFSSANGVDFFLRRLWHAGLDARRLGSVKLAAMGSGTAERLARYHLRADLVPEEFVAESLARSLLGAGSSGGGRLLLARASRGRDTLAETLRAAGAQVDEVVVYSSEDVEAPHPEVRAALAAGEIDWIPVTSSAAARSLVRLYGDVLRGVRFASIGPITSATLRELGFAPAIEASPHTTGALADAILEVHDT
jgi:uroporphyrinogen III methyltransferase/synthase